MLTVAWVNFTNTDKRGPEKRFIEYMVHLNRVQKYEVKIVALFPFFSKDTSIFNTFNENGVEYYEVQNSHYGKLFSPNENIRKEAYNQFKNNLENMKAVLKKINCDIVVSNCTIVWEAAFAAKALGLKHILFIRGIFNPCDIPPNVMKLPMLRFMERKLLQLSPCIVTQSEHTAKLWGLDQIDCYRKVIPVASYEIGGEEPSWKVHNPMKILVLAGIESYKNQGLILDVASRLKEKGYAFEFNIYGNHVDISYRAYIEQELIRRQLTNHIHIRPYEMDIDKLYKEHDMVFIPSTLETFGIVVCEAMARYKPVISTKCGGPEETIIHGETGFLVEIAEIDTIVEAFIKLLESPATIKEMGIAGRKRWEDNYQMSVVIDQWVKLLLEEGKTTTKLEEDIEPLLIEIQEKLEVTTTLPVTIEHKKEGCKNWLIVTKSIHSPSVRIGLGNNLHVLEKEGLIQFKVVSCETCEEHLQWADCIIFSRIMDFERIVLLDRAKALGKRTLYYADDSLYEVPNFARSNKNYNSEQALKGLAYFIHNTEMFIGCSEWLAENYRQKYNCKAISLRPAVNPTLIKPRKVKSDKVVIGFAGNVDYEFFIEKMKPLFISLHKKYQDKIQFEFFGPKISFLDEINGLYFASTEYEYYEMVLARRNWDIGIAYLEESTYSNKKFYNKYIEYSRFGIPGIYSNTELFRRIVNDGYNGLLADNTVEGWHNQIEKLICDEKLRKDLAIVAKNHVLETFSPQNGANEIKTKLREFL